jgi:tyrosyl-tRNA synthetase
VTPDEISGELRLLTKGCVEVIPAEELAAKLRRARSERRPLTVKVGFDPSAPDLHLGHTVVIRKMRHFQQLGHRVVFVIGDFTGLIGDPTGKKATRPQLTRDEIEANAATYERQIYKLLDPELTVIDFNERWLGALSSEEWIRLAATVTVAQMLEREDFRTRYQAQQPIALHEFLYPLAQAYDSVALEADVELGGTDQLFNLMIGRQVMRERGMEPQVVMTLPLLEGLDGVEKMSKSLGNYIAVEDPPFEMYGKLMSISDELMWRYWLLVTDRGVDEIQALQEAVHHGRQHPMDVKKELARVVVADFHSPVLAASAQEEFERVFSRRNRPSEVPTVELAVDGGSVLLSKALVGAGLAASNSEARRLLEQGAVKLDGEPATDPKAALDAHTEREVLIQVGKRRFVKLVLTDAG